jgi:hypothetical protein
MLLIDKAVINKLSPVKTLFQRLEVCQTNQIVVLIRQKIVSIWMLLSIIMKLPASAITIS